MPNIGPLELLLLGVLLVLLFGPAKLPEIGRSIGRTTRDFKDTIAGTGIDDAISTVNEVRSVASPTNLAKAAMPAPVKEMAAGVTEMKETFTDPLGMKKKDEPAPEGDGAAKSDAAQTAGVQGAATAAVAAASSVPAPAAPAPEPPAAPPA
jgi:sec-independent protein translocase protein TatA